MKLDRTKHNKFVTGAVYGNTTSGGITPSSSTVSAVGGGGSTIIIQGGGSSQEPVKLGLGDLTNVGTWANEVATEDRFMVLVADGNQWVAKPISDIIYDESDLATYAKISYVNEKLADKVDNAFFLRIFGVIGENDEEIPVNDVSSTIKSILAKFGLWTYDFLSAIGLNPTDGEITAISLASLNDVLLNLQLIEGQALVWNGSFWTNQSIKSGLDENSLLKYLYVNKYVTQDYVAEQLLSYATIGELNLFKVETSKSLDNLQSEINDLDDKKLDKSFFKALFGLMDNDVEIEPNVKEIPESASIKAKFGLWTEEYLSALGMNPADGEVALTLSSLNDVLFTNLKEGQSVVWDGGKWVNLLIESGLNESALDIYLNENNYAKKGDIPSLDGYATNEGVSAELAKYLPLSGGTLTGHITLPNKIYIRTESNSYAILGMDGNKYILAAPNKPTTIRSNGTLKHNDAIIWDSKTLTNVSQLTNDANYATTSDLDNRIDALVNGAPAAYDTLKEIADVLANNINSIDDILTALGTKVSKDDFNTAIANVNNSISALNTELSGKIDLKLDAITFNELFEKVQLEDGTWAIKAKLGLFSDGFISAKGSNVGGTSSEGGAVTLYQLNDVLADGQQVSGAAKGALLMYNGTKWEGVSQSEITPDLTGYATESWVLQQGYLTQHQDLSEYAKLTDIPTIPTTDINKGVTAYGWGDHSKVGYLTGITSKLVTDALGYTPYDVANFTKAKIKSTLGISDWALASSKPSYTTKEVAEDTNLYFTNARAVSALKSITDGLQNDIDTKLDASVFSELFEKVTLEGGVTAIRAKYGLFTDYFLSAKGANTNGGSTPSGNQYTRLDTWDGYTTAMDGWVLSAKLGKGLYDTQNSLITRVGALEGKATNVSFTQSLTSGTQIGSISIDGVAKNIYAPTIPTSDINKGVTAYGWGNHASVGYAMTSALGGYQTKITSSNKLDYSLISGVPTKLSQFTDDVVSGKYLQLSGGTITGLLTINGSSTNNNRATIHLVSNGNYPNDLYFGSNGTLHWSLSSRDSNNKYYFGLYNAITTNWVFIANSETNIIDYQYLPTYIGNKFIHEGNYTDYTYSKSTIDTKLGGYLPLSGGTIRNSVAIPLVINNSTDGSASCINFRVANVDKAQIGYENALQGAILYNYNSRKFIGVKDDGTPVYSGSTLWHSGNFTPSDYLPLSGGTLSGQLTISANNTDVLVLNSLIGDSTATGGTYIKINYKGSKVAEIGHGWSLGTYMMANGNTIRITDNGIGYVNNDTIIHSGNIGSQSVANATTIRGWDINIYNGKPFGGIPIVANAGNMMIGRYLDFYYNNSEDYYSTRLQCSNARYIDITLPSTNGTLALLTDNVASATKLQTARTIWGQSFDGTNYIEGALYGVTSVSFSSEGAILNLQGLQAIDIMANYLNIGYGYAINGKDTYIGGNNLYLRYGTSSTTGLVLNSSGNVGIGTSSPSHKLTINGAIAFSSDSDATIGACYSTTDNTTTYNKIKINPNANGIQYYSGGWTSGDHAAHQFITSISESVRMVIMNTTGNVGIGTTSPQAKLDVNGNAIIVASSKKGAMASAISSSAIVEIGGIGKGNDALYIGQLDNSTIWLQSAYGGSSSIASSSYTYPLVLNPIGGNVGIGTTTPKGTLDMSNNGENNVYISCKNDSIASLNFTNKDVTNWQISSRSSAYGKGLQIFSFDGSTWTNCMTFCKSSNVLIGTATDNGYKLDVNGTLHASGAATFGGHVSIVSDNWCEFSVTRGTGGTSSIGGIDGNGVYFAHTQNSATTYMYLKSGKGLSVYGTLYSSVGIYSDGYVSAKGQNTSSDMRLKNVLNEVILSVKDIAKAPSVRFAWKNGGGVDVGSSAQYWQGLLPDAVKERDGMLEMQYANIALLSAIAIAKNVETHEERIARLEKENKELRTKIDMMERGIA